MPLSDERRAKQLYELQALGCIIEVYGPDGTRFGNLEDLDTDDLDKILIELDPKVIVSDDGRSITYLHGE